LGEVGSMNTKEAVLRYNWGHWVNTGRPVASDGCQV
jgi:hypothetical protein